MSTHLAGVESVMSMQNRMVSIFISPHKSNATSILASGYCGPGAGVLGLFQVFFNNLCHFMNTIL